MLSRREQFIAIATLAVVLLFVLDRLVVTPLLDKHALLQAEEARLIAEKQHAGVLLREQRHAARRWDELTGQHLADDPSLAESAILHAVRDWSRQAGLTLSSVQPDRSTRQAESQQILFAVAGAGDIDAVARFLFRLEQAKLPVRVERMRVGLGGEGRLNLDLRLSTVFHSPPKQQDASPEEGA